jgi:spermidine synthase
MQPWHTVESARAPDGTELVLARRGDEWAIRAAGHVLMSSRAHASEEALAAIALRRVARPRTVLLGGLGLGFTLRAALDRLPPDARAIVAELVPELVAWNRGVLAELAGRPLDDPRVRLQVGDVAGRIAEARSAFDAILLDVDNGPSALVHAANDRLYGDRGVSACRDALRTGGVLAVWSASSDAGYRERLERAGFDVEETPVAAQRSGGRRHVIFVASRGALLSRGGAPTARPAGRGGASPGYSVRAAPPSPGAGGRAPTGRARGGRR